LFCPFFCPFISACRSLKSMWHLYLTIYSKNTPSRAHRASFFKHYSINSSLVIEYTVHLKRIWMYDVGFTRTFHSWGWLLLLFP
jgi:hypothetical protein